MGDPEARQARKDKEEAERIARADKRAEKKANRRPGLFAGINDALGSERAKKQEAEPTDADKAAATAAIEADQAATAASDTPEEAPEGDASTPEASENETAPEEGDTPEQGVNSKPGPEEFSRMFIKSAEDNLRKSFKTFRDARNAAEQERRTNGQISSRAQVALDRANSSYQSAQFMLNEARRGAASRAANEQNPSDS